MNYMQDTFSGMQGLLTALFKPTLLRENLFTVWSKNTLMTKMPGFVTSCRLVGFVAKSGYNYDDPHFRLFRKW